MTGLPLDRRIRIEYPVNTNTSGRSVVVWTLLAVVWASVRDTPPSRSEAVRNGVVGSRTQSTVQFMYRQDIDVSMRIVVNGRTLQIVGGPAEIGNHWRTEVVVESVDL